MLNPFFRTLATLAVTGAALMVPPVSASADEPPDGQDPSMTYLLRMPLPGPATDLETITPEKYVKLDQAFCTTDDMKPETLEKIDNFYRNVLPVVFAPREGVKDPVIAAREEVVGSGAFTNKTRLALCDKKSEYHEALVRQINQAEILPAEKLRDADLTADDKKVITERIWGLRLAAFRDALGDWLIFGEI